MNRKSKSKEIIKEYRREIFVGIITSVVWASILWLIKSAPKVGKTIFGTIQNLIYSCASQMSIISLITLLLGIIFGSLFALTIIPLLFKFLKHKYDKLDEQLEKECEEYEKRIDELYSKIELYEKDVPKNNIEIEKCLKEIKQINYEFLNGDSSSKNARRRSKLPIIMTLILIVYVIVTVIIPVYLLDSFNHDIKMITPYADSKTIMMLESDWTRMRSKDDYDKIYDTINRIKDENNLPKK